MAINTKYRTKQAEIMDDFSIQGEELYDALDKIAAVNKLLGGNAITLDGITKLLNNTDPSKPVTIADIGCGNGDMLRMLAGYAKKNGRNFNLIGVDANAFTIEHAQMLSSDYPSMSYKCVDVFSEDFKELQYDIALCTLTLHHFDDNEIVNIITTFKNNAALGVVVNDLHRSKAAYYLFSMICTLFSLKRLPREDGLVSILRGFKKEDLEVFSRKLALKKYSIRWKWAFRYQWIIYNV